MANFKQVPQPGSAVLCAGGIPVPTAAKLARATVMAIAVFVGLTGCTQRQVYDAAQQNHALECQKYPDRRYEECMATVEKDYPTYQREREELSREAPPADP